MNTSLDDMQQKMVKRFNFFTSQKDKYMYLMEMGKKLPKFNEEWKIPENIIKGCLSRVWLHTELKDGKMYFYANSDALFVGGMISLLLQIYNERTPQEILESKLDYLNELGLLDQIAANRANGLNQMVKRILQEAQKHQTFD